MNVSDDTRPVLNIIGGYIASGEKGMIPLDLSGLASTDPMAFLSVDPFQDSKQAIAGCLAEIVTELDPNLTVRLCAQELHARQIGDKLIYLVVCDVHTPEGVVTGLTDDMMLVSFGTTPNSLNIDAPRA